MTQLTITHIDTCLACYLTDHHNRDGELLIGVPVYGSTTRGDVLDGIFGEIAASDGSDMPETIGDDMIRAAALDGLFGSTNPPTETDLTTLFDASLDDTSEDEDNIMEDPCQAWFLLTWED